MLRLLLLSLVIYGQVSSHNVFRQKPSYSGNDNSGSISNSGNANSGTNSGTISYGANSGNENFGNHRGNNVNVKENSGSYSGNDNSGSISNSGNANSGDNSGTINYGANNGNENFGNYNVSNDSRYSGNDNSGFISNSGDANTGINYGTINNGANNGNTNFGNHNGDTVYNNNKDITNLGHHFGINYHGNNHNGNNIFSNSHGIQNFGTHLGNNNFGNNFGSGNYGSYNWNKKTTTATTTIATPTTSVTVPTTTTTSPTTRPTRSTTTTITTTSSTTGIYGTTIRHCTCNGAIDANDLGKCTKEDVWCYVDPESDCNDSDVWNGEFGFGWTYSYEACEAQLEMEYAGECNAVAEKAEANQTNDNECTCNGVVDTNNGGECLKPWVGNFWCYVAAESGCLDSQVWFGKFGFCQTYSFQACGFTNTSSDIEFDTKDNTSTSTVSYEVATVLTPDMTILGEECSCSGVIDDDNLGECTKKTVWCYVHPDAPCNDTLAWSGQFGYGWTYSYQACEAQLALTHKDECQLPSQANQTDVMSSEDGECSCNGDVDSNDGGECLKAWVGVLWCYVDLQSGCQDTKVWYGEFGFCQNYSFKACEGFNNNTVAAEEVFYRL